MPERQMNLRTLASPSLAPLRLRRSGEGLSWASCRSLCIGLCAGLSRSLCLGLALLLAPHSGAPTCAAQQSGKAETGEKAGEARGEAAQPAAAQREAKETALPGPQGASAAATAPGGALLELLDGSVVLSPEEARALALFPPRAPGESQRLRAGSREVALEDILFLSFPPEAGGGEADAGDQGREAAGAAPARGWLFILRALGEARASEVLARVEEGPPPTAGAGAAESVRLRIERLRGAEAPTPPGEAESFRVALDAIQGVVFPSTAPRGAALFPGSFERRRERLRQEVLQYGGSKDVVVLPEGGRVEGITEALEARGLRFNSDKDGDVRLAEDKVGALLLAKVGDSAPARPPGAATAGVRLRLRNDSSIEGRLGVIFQGEISLEHPWLGPVKARFEDVSEIAFLGGKATFLSDLTPTRVEEDLGPLFPETKRPFRRDQSVLGEPIRLGGRHHHKGLGVHANSRLEFALPGAHSRFQAVIGLDESARPTGRQATGQEAAVLFRVLADGEMLLEKPMSWRDAPLPVDLPLAGRKTLTLEVLAGSPPGSLDALQVTLDRADWGDARLIR